MMQVFNGEQLDNFPPSLHQKVIYERKNDTHAGLPAARYL